MGHVACDELFLHLVKLRTRVLGSPPALRLQEDFVEKRFRNARSGSWTLALHPSSPGYFSRHRKLLERNTLKCAHCFV